MSEIMKVRQLENKNQFILENDDEIIFQSYNSLITVVDKNKGTLTLGLNWDYSRTTLKHLYIFLDYNAIYYLNYELKGMIIQTKESTNRRIAIQKLIDNKQIKYDENLV